MTPLLRFLIRVPMVHRIVHRLTARGDGYENPDGSWQFPDCAIDRYIWGRLLSDEQFVAALERGKADYAAGRFTRYRADEPFE